MEMTGRFWLTGRNGEGGNSIRGKTTRIRRAREMVRKGWKGTAGLRRKKIISKMNSPGHLL